MIVNQFPHINEIMAVLIPSSILSLTKEAAVLETAMLLQVAEDAFVPATGEQKQNRVQVSFNADSNTVTIQATLQMVSAISPDGSIKLTAQPYC